MYWACFGPKEDTYREKEKSKKAANTNHITHAGMLCNGNGLNMFMIK